MNPVVLRRLPALLAGLALSPAAFAADPGYHLFADTIGYASWNGSTPQMDDVWSHNTGNTPVLVAEPAPSTSKYFTLANGVVTRTLDTTLTQDFEILIDVLHGDYSRGIWVGLFNAAATQGYGFLWDSSSSGSQGFLSIRKFTISGPGALVFNSYGTALGATIASGRSPVSGPLAKMKLTWNKDTGTLKLYIDGVLKLTRTDTAYASFSRLFVSGNGTTALPAKFDNVAVRVPAGADVPFTTYEAENPLNTTNGTIVSMTTLPSSTTSTPELEASGRAFVELTSSSHYVEFKNVRAANRIFIRHCVPDATGGGGSSTSVDLYINGTLRQTFSLPSKYNWLYGTAGTNGQSNLPTDGTAHVFWDDTAFTLTTAIAAGDTIRLRKTTTGGFCRLDLIDLETAPDPLPAPAAGTYLSVTDYGATGDDSTDDTQAIKDCIAAAEAASPKKIIWFPVGSYRVSEKFTLKSSTVRGAGMWHTVIIGTVAVTGFNGHVGFHLSNETGNTTGPKVYDVRIMSIAHTYRNNNLGGRAFTCAKPTTNWVIENVWMQHLICGVWMGDCHNGVIRNSRVYLSYADAINLNLGNTGNLAENNYVRGAGDDGVAILSETSFATASANAIVRRNTVVANWWGHNIDIAGGSGHLAEYNYVADNSHAGVLTYNRPSGTFAMHNLTNTSARRNVLIRGGSNYVSQKRGALWIYSAAGTIGTNTTANDNFIIDPLFRGIHITGSQSQVLTFERDFIDGPSENPVFITSSTTGSATFNNNQAINVPAGFSGVRNDSGSYSVTQSGNSWPP